MDYDQENYELAQLATLSVTEPALAPTGSGTEAGMFAAGLLLLGLALSWGARGGIRPHVR